MTRFRSVVLDVDSTLSGLEGIDWLAAQRGPDAAESIARLTQLAMAGERRLEDVFELRLSAVRPSRRDVERLAEEYAASVAPGAAAAIAAMQAAGIRVVIVSGGIREAVVPFAEGVGVAPGNVHAVSLSFTPGGEFADFDRTTPLSRQFGKKTLVENLELSRPIIAVGDGATDAEIRPAVDCFVAFTGFAAREAVVRRADESVATFRELQELVLG